MTIHRSTVVRAANHAVVPLVRLVLIALLALAGGVSTLAAQAVTPRDSARAEAGRELLRRADSTALFEVRLADGSTFIGRVASIQGSTATLIGATGTLTIDLAHVRQVTPIRAEDLRDGEYWFPNPNTTRLLFAPTGKMLKRGQGYFSDYMVFFPGFAVGLSDRVSIGGGMSLFPGVGLDEQLFFFTPKVGVYSARGVDLALGALWVAIPGDEIGGEHVGIAYGVGTFGGERGAVTIGAGLGYADGDFARDPAIVVGGDRRISRRVGLVTENYFFPGVMDGALVSGGLRFFGERMALDFGLVAPVGEKESYPIPFVGFVVNFP